MYAETSEQGLFVAGDALGIAQGILQAMATGVTAALGVLQQTRTYTRQSQRDRLIYDRYWTTGEYYAPADTFITLVNSLTIPGERAPVLADLGCGLGRHSLYAALNGVHVIAIDHNSRAIARLREKVSDLPIDILECDFVNWLQSSPTRSIDAIVCFDAIHHTGCYDSVTSALADVRRVVRPGGLVLITLLADIDYGVGGAPARRLLISVPEAEHLLDSAFCSDITVRKKCSRVSFDSTVNLDSRTGQIVNSYYRAHRVLRLFQIQDQSAQLL